MKIIKIIVVAALLTGCGPFHNMNVIRESVDKGQIHGMDKETKFSHTFGIPGGTIHPGPYHAVDEIRVKVETGEYMGKNATFFLGNSRASVQWEIFSVMVEEDGKWRTIPLQ